MKRRWPLLALLVASFVFVLPANAGHTHVAANTNPQTFTDTQNDGGSAPDVRTVVVSNDASGTYRVRINVASISYPSDVLIVVALDTDQNASTGNGGYDYALLCDESNGAVGLVKWNGSQFTLVNAPSLSASDDSTGITLTINRADVGNSGGFNFEVDSLEGNGDAGHADYAPDNGTWNYQLAAAAPLALNLSQFAAPKTVKAGKSFLVTMLVTRSDTGQFVDDEIGGAVSCRATYGKKRVPLTGAGFIETTKPELAACLFRAPKAARGKTIRGSITVTVENVKFTKTFAIKVR